MVAAIAIPVALLGLAEGGLRLAGYGYDTHLFQKQEFKGQLYEMNNERFSDRFFPRALERWPCPILMPEKKAPGTFRIFVMGESAAMGDPQPAYGPSRYLEALLRERYPGVNFEVENVGITAINSHVILPIARECAQHEGDLWIIYMGNNEMVGPFGGATVFGRQAPPLWFVRFSLALQKTRLGQALMDLGRRLRGKKSGPAQWGGMEMFLGNTLAPDDPRKERVYGNFQQNLRDILRAGLGSGAKVVLCTVAVNLKDCPPFASLPPSPADDEFRRGRDLLASSNYAAARGELQKACDDDALPFRADDRINGIISRTSMEMAGSNLELCDAARESEGQEPDQVCGQETFYEHVHFNFAGAYRLGRLWADATEKFLPDGIKKKAQGEWASAEVCDRRLGLTAWNRADTLHSVMLRMRKPPLNTQANNAWRIGQLEAELHDVELGTKPGLRAAARALYDDAIRRNPNDYYLREDFGEFDEVVGDLRDAAEQWRQAYELMPRNPYAYFSEGQLMAKLGKNAEARAALRQAIAVHPDYAEAWLELGKVDASEHNLETATQEYRKSIQCEPLQPEAYLCLGKALSLEKRPAESEASFEKAIELNPEYWEAFYALGGELGVGHDFAGARRAFEEVARLNPSYAMGHLNLGVALLKLNDAAGAAAEFREAARLDSAAPKVRAYLEAAEAMEKR